MFLGLIRNPAEEIAAAYNDGQFDAEVAHFRKFSRDFMNAGSVDAETLIGGQGLAGDFQQDALEDWFRHETPQFLFSNPIAQVLPPWLRSGSG